jgi:hypothetical protein
VTPLIKSFFKRFQTIPISKPLDVSVFLIFIDASQRKKFSQKKIVLVGYSEEHKHKGPVWWKSIFLFYSRIFGFGSNFGGEWRAAAAESHSWI